MIQTGIESRVKIQDIVANQLPEFVLDESPKTIDFLKQYYISQEYQGGPVDISDNLDQYLRVDNLKPEVIVDSVLLTNDVTSSDTIIQVSSTKGFPSQYGLLKIDEEIITYTGITTNSFTGCIRGFSGISEFNQESTDDLVFSTSTASQHASNTEVKNLSSLFLKEFYKKLKTTFTPGLENIKFADEIDAGNFIKRAKDFYASKGTDEAIKILFKVIFAESPSIINLENYLIKPSAANYVRREVVVAEAVSGEPLRIIGETLVKTTDENTKASISSIEPFTRKGKTFYVIEFYVSNDGRSSVEGNFVITPNTKLTETASIGDSIINVDSTLSFPESGNLVSGNNTISYTGKSINQFFGCTGILSTLNTASNIRSNDTYFSYENGDLNKKVEIIILGVIDDIKEKNEDFKVGEGDIITIKNFGDKIENNRSNWKEIFANSLIYNTSARYEILDNSSNKLSSPIDRSSLKVGDEVEILTRGNQNPIFSSNPIYILSIDEEQNTLTLQNRPNLGANQKYDVRRKLNKTKSSGFGFESNSIISDILNLYVEDDEYAYVASNSLPSIIRSDFLVNDYRLDIQANIKTVSISSTANLSDFSDEVFNSITVSEVPFLTGDVIFYDPEEVPLVGLVTGTYFVEKVSNTKFKLYGSRSLISSGNNLTFTPSLTGIGTHNFTLNSQKDSVLGIQKTLRKIPLEKNIKLGGEETVPGTTGILINGVEIQNYKSSDAVYFGPIESVNVLSGGENFDVINIPKIEVSSGIGTSPVLAKIQPVISGKFEKVYIDSQDYDIDKIVSVEISGGNGKGAVIEPVLVNKPRSVLFNADESTSGGGVDLSTNQISFLTDHNFVNGQQVIYNSLGNEPISIGDGIYNFGLPDNSSYFVGVSNNKTIKLYYSLNDQQSDKNPVGIFTGSLGSHRFSTVATKKQIDYVKIIDGGEGYTNRKLIVKSSGISTTENTVNFKNHGFNDGELVDYNYEISEISGISKLNQYYILKINDDSFRLCDAGIGGTITSNYERENYEKFNSRGSGYQYFSYPEISVSIKYSKIGIGTTTQEDKELVTTPVVKGQIIDGYVYESGTGYGSTIINYEDKPNLTIQNGKLAQLTPIVVDGKITNVSVSYQGIEYNSVPDLIVSGSGVGAELRAIVDNGRISDVIVLNTGIGYSASNTSIQVIPSGKNAIIDPQIRKLIVNDNSDRFSTGEVLLPGKDKLQYSISKYFESLRSSFLEDGSLSGIIGWAYDGNPIYGPYGYIDPGNIFSGLKTLNSGYILDITNISDRPPGFQDGFFIEDYKFDDSGDLDEYNGRYEKNDEYPNGVYAYHATIDEFPYFIGNKYQSKLISDSNLDQSFDFNNSNLLRNTFPYKVSEKNADYDFINETSDVLDQKIEVLSVTSGPIQSVEIQNSGDNYKINDKLIFDNENTSGRGLDVNVKSIKGKNITDVNTNSILFLDSIFTWNSSNEIKVSIIPNHNLSNLDYVTVTGFSTILSELNGSHRISVVSNPDATSLSTITSSSSGFTTEIYVSPISEQISVGSSIGIGTEILKVIGVFNNDNILRVERGLSGVSHAVGSAVSFLSDSFIISKSVDKFTSKVNTSRFFNPKESIGVSTISGVGYSTSFIFGNNTITKSIPSKSISIENHSFTTNQSVIYTSNGTNISVSTDGSSTFDLPTNLFVINKNPNLIGLKTAIDGNELFFHTNGDDNDKYLIKSNYNQILGDVEKNEVTVSVSTSHELQSGDDITLNIKPNLSVGIGTSTSTKVLYNSIINSIVVNPIEFNSTGINTDTNIFTIIDHGLKTGDKILYEDSDYDEYFVFKINNNKFNLCETYFDSQQNPPTIVSFASTGGSSQIISLINPEINPIKNNNLVFDLSDSSLSGYEFKIYKDSKFENEFISTGSTSNFLISEIGTPGISTSFLTLNYISDIPEELYYAIEKNGVLINPDIDVKNNSKIKYIDSKYNNTYSITDVGITSFKINLQQKPEKLSYSSTECDNISYFTTSSFASGPVNSLNIISFGSEYKNLPKLKSVKTTNGTDLIVNCKSNLFGMINEKNIINNRFTYSSDKTLRPEADVSPTITLKDFNTINDILIVNSGEGYVTPPLLKLVNSSTREIIDSGLINLNLTGSAISSIDIEVEPVGLPDESVEIFATNNTNGVSVIEVESSNSGIFTCTISTPGIGNTFPFQPFNIGDKVFVEGIVKNSIHGTGFNSEDYGFKFFDVTNYFTTGLNDKVELSVSGLSTNTGIANTVQNYSGVIINKNEYPEFNVIQKESKFFIGESISSNGVIRDLVVTENKGNGLKVSGNYTLSAGEKIKGIESGSEGTINTLKINEAVFDVKFSNLKDIGWNTEIGKLSEDYQVIQDNDYYQNLSYSVKSSVTYKDQQAPVESLVHTSGLKNFADTGITSSVSAGLDDTKDGFIAIYDLISQQRVDTINNFDNVFDEDIVNSTSKFLRMENVKLTNFNEFKNLNVLKIDDLSKRFSNSEAENTEFLTVEEVDDKTYYNYLFRVTTTDEREIQFTDLTILSNGIETVIVENESLHNSNIPLGNFDIDENEFSETFLKFFPEDPFNKDYDVKLIQQTFNDTFSGVGTQSVGFTSLTGSSVSGIGTTTICSFNSDHYESIYVNAQVLDKATDDMNYVRLYVAHDGSNSYMSEYFIDNNLSATTGNSIGTFSSQLNNGILSVIHENVNSNQLIIRSNIVGFGSTALGIGTYRFKSFEQLDGQERSVIYESDFKNTVSLSSTIINSLDKSLFNSSKSLVQVSAGSTKALHQVMMVFDGTDVYTQQLPFLSVSNTDTLDNASGLGTFGASISGPNIILEFYPDDQNQQIDIEIFNKAFYSRLDVANEYNDLTYGSVVEKVDEKFYNAINGDRINRTNFTLTSNNIPIFSKTFNPNSVSLASTSGLFSIDDHFFMTGEELIYTPDSTIVGVGTSSMMINATDVLPSRVYAIKVTEDTFKVAITTTAAANGIGVTFTSLGEGNAHRFTMKEKNSKCIIDVDELVQYPIRFTGTTHSLLGNLSAGATITSLSGISSINPTDLLLVDDEYMKVTNVGLGTTSTGPIIKTGNIKLVELDRGVVGSSASAHSNSATVSVFRGSFNIVDDEIHFSEAPRGNPQIDRTESNLNFETSSFGGRAFLQSNYGGNKIYDDISNQFTGIGRTYNLTVGGSNTIGLGTDGGRGLIFINNIYQSPKTDNNPTRFNYEIVSTASGITTVEFSGITRFEDPTEYVVSDYDINQNESPRGGIIVSFGSTPGLGFAPLVGASVTAVVGAGGSIVSVGLGTTDNLGSGYNGLVSIGVTVFEEGHSGTPAEITATANVGAGGTLTFNIVNAGTGYTSPSIFVSDPSYENLPVIGISREGIGSTTETGVGLLMDVIVGGSTTTGIGSTYFEVKEFKFSRPGYGFKRGDVFKPIGIVTDSTLSSPISEFAIDVVDTYSDNFAAWEFGELDYIDSVQNFQDGSRVRFPLNYNGELLSFEAKPGSPISENMNNVLIIFINGVIQEPGKNYIFKGGTSFVFTKAPLPEDEVEIYFYKGVDGVDSISNDNQRPTIKVGDTLQVISNNNIENTITQDKRIAFNIAFSDKVETNKYFGRGIDLVNPKPVSWTKQKTGRKVNGDFVSKSRDVLEALIFPTSRIIKDISITDTDIFVDNAELFGYEDNRNLVEAPLVPYPDGSRPFDALIINGISTTGFTTDLIEKVTGFNNVEGFTGIITGISTTTGTGGNPLAIQFTVIDDSTVTGFVGLETGYPIYIYDTQIGSGVTSINSSNSEVVGIGTTCIDNIYYVSEYSFTSLNVNTFVGILTCNIHSDTNISGISSSGNILNPIGKYSWGRLSGASRSSNPISVGVTGNIISGLTTFPTIQRRGGVNIRKTGALPKIEK